MATPSDGRPPVKTPQQGSMNYPSHQPYNSYRGVKKSQSGSVSGNSSKRKGY